MEVIVDACLQHLLHSNKHHTQKINNFPGKCILSIKIKGEFQSYSKTQVRHTVSCTYTIYRLPDKPYVSHIKLRGTLT